MHFRRIVRDLIDFFYFNDTSVTFSIPINVKWIKVNSGQNGYYRVLYDEDNWGYIVEELKLNHESFSPMVNYSIACCRSFIACSLLNYIFCSIFRIELGCCQMHSHYAMLIWCHAKLQWTCSHIYPKSKTGVQWPPVYVTWKNGVAFWNIRNAFWCWPRW